MKKKRERKSSMHISLVLISSVAIAGCGQDGYRHIYKSMADCRADWKSGGCEDIDTDSSDYSRGRAYGPFVHANRSTALGSRSSLRSTAVSAITRGGFSSSSSSHGGSSRS